MCLCNEYVIGLCFIGCFLPSFLHANFYTALRPFHTEHEKVKRISDVITRWNKTTASYGCFYIDREHSCNENANVFFFRSIRRLFCLLSEKTRLVKKSHVQSYCCYPKGRRGDAKSSEDCIEHEHKNTEVEGFFRKREE